MKNSHRKSGILGLSYMKITENIVQIKVGNVNPRKPQIAKYFNGLHCLLG